MQLPVQYTENMRALLGEEFDAYVKSFEEPRLYGLRVNTAKISVEEFLRISPFHLTPVPWVDNGFYYEEADRPSRHPYYFAGLYYLQEPSAMTPAFVLPVEEGDRVLDLCAAPGGKSTELGAKLKGSGLLVSNDISASRAKALLKNIEVFGIGNVLVTCEYPEQLAQRFGGFFDKILVDAPCSGEGMFRKDNKLIKSWESQGPDFFAPIQRNILWQAADMLKEGGFLLYSTCTFAKEEDEDNIRDFLEHHEDFELIPIYEDGQNFEKDLVNHSYEGFVRGYGMPQAIRLFPHHLQGEGHFVALLHRKGMRTSNVNPVSKPNGKIPAEVLDFLKSIDKDIDCNRIEINGEKVYLMPPDLQNIKKLRILRSGLLLGEVKKNRFEPSQALAMTLDPADFDCVIDLPLEDENVLRYLKGETIDVKTEQIRGNGKHVLIAVDGYALGFGKLSGVTVKNKYLPGWRWM